VLLGKFRTTRHHFFNFDQSAGHVQLRRLRVTDVSESDTAAVVLLLLLLVASSASSTSSVSSSSAAVVVIGLSPTSPSESESLRLVAAGSQ
jgi:hypothetical protein